MKPIHLIAVLSLMILTACDNPNVQQTAQNLGVENFGEIGTNLVINAVQNECENRIQNGEALTDTILTADQKANLCGCTSRELRANLSADKLGEFVRNGTVDTQAISDVVTGAMATCTARQPAQTTPPDQSSTPTNAT